jgi:hypothetical protein
MFIPNRYAWQTQFVIKAIINSYWKTCDDILNNIRIILLFSYMLNILPAYSWYEPDLMVKQRFAKSENASKTFRNVRFLSKSDAFTLNVWVKYQKPRSSLSVIMHAAAL